MCVGACQCVLIHVDMLIDDDIGAGDSICGMICSCVSWRIHVVDDLLIDSFMEGHVIGLYSCMATVGKVYPLVI